MAHDSFSYSSLDGNNARVSGGRPFANNPLTTEASDTPRVRSYAAACVSSSVYGLLSSGYERSPHMDIGTRFGQKLRELRHTRGMTQIDAAVMLGIDRSYLSEVERGKKGISLATLEIIALGFRLPLSDLLGGL